MKIAVEAFGRALGIELSGVFCRTQEDEPAQEPVRVGSAETEVDQEKLTRPFGFAADIDVRK